MPDVGPEDAVQSVLDRESWKAERAYSIVRAVFCAAVLARWHLRDWASGGEYTTPARADFSLAGILAVFLFCGYVLTRVREPRHIRPLLPISVTLDAVFCGWALASRLLWPAPGEPTLIGGIDVATIMLMVFASGLRLSRPASVLGGGLNLLSFSILVAIERTINPEPTSAAQIGMGVLLICGSAVMSWLTATRTRRLVAESAERGVVIQRANEGFEELAKRHHDMRSLVASAVLNADLASRRASEPDPQALARQLAELKTDLELVQQSALSLHGDSYDRLLATQELADASLGRAIERVVAHAKRRFQEVRFSVDGAPGTHVRVAGGQSGLERVLSNLVINACEGDGGHGAEHVELSVDAEASPESVKIRVADDGPGFAEPGPSSELPVGPSSKASGTGLGLLIVQRLVSLSGGRVERRNREPRGAEIALELQLARIGLDGARRA